MNNIRLILVMFSAMVSLSWSSPVNGPVVKTFDAGPLRNQETAKKRCPAVCEKDKSVWTGHWWTTTPGIMSVCQCKLLAPTTRDDVGQPPIEVIEKPRAMESVIKVVDKCENRSRNGAVYLCPGGHYMPHYARRSDCQLKVTNHGSEQDGSVTFPVNRDTTYQLYGSDISFPQCFGPPGPCATAMAGDIIEIINEDDDKYKSCDCRVIKPSGAIKPSEQTGPKTCPVTP